MNPLLNHILAGKRTAELQHAGERARRSRELRMTGRKSRRRNLTARSGQDSRGSMTAPAIGGAR